MSANQFGFRVVDFLDIERWRILALDDSIPMATQQSCPIDTTPLRTICTFVGNSGAQRVRVGCCPSCGYTGYIDRPTKEWIISFYFNTFSGAQDVDIEKEVVVLKERAEKGDLGKITEINRLIEKIRFDKNRPVCEIGSGIGTTLKQLEQKGFTHLIGMETSGYRAELARRAFGLNVLTGPFEDAHIQSELQKHTPIGLIFSYHVLEHVYDPAEIISRASALQKEGDYMIVVFPNLEGEVSMISLAFFPHLHAFSRTAIETLLNKNNYAIIDDSMTGSRVHYLIAKKVTTAPYIISNKGGHFERVKNKFIKGLGLDKSYADTPRRFWWYRKLDVGGQQPLYQNPFFESMHWWVTSQLNKYRRRDDIIAWVSKDKFRKNYVHQSIAVANLTHRYTTYEESPIEIQFDGPIKLFYK